jgi:hypothetical protein
MPLTLPAASRAVVEKLLNQLWSISVDHSRGPFGGVLDHGGDQFRDHDSADAARLLRVSQPSECTVSFDRRFDALVLFNAELELLADGLLLLVCTAPAQAGAASQEAVLAAVGNSTVSIGDNASGPNGDPHAHRQHPPRHRRNRRTHERSQAGSSGRPKPSRRRSRSRAYIQGWSG